MNPLPTGPVIGIDFGTTNSVVTALRADGSVATLRHGNEDVFRSILCFWRDGAGRARHAAGPAAIEAYLDEPFDTRLLLSMKSHLAQRSFSETRIQGRSLTIEHLIALFLREWLAPFGEDLAGARIMAGRPVRFVGEKADDALGEQRLRAAFAAAGLPDVEFALEPAAAGHRFAQGLDHPATVLVADFGGGTSDFSLLRFTPGAGVTALGHAGLGLAGDALDFRIMDHVVAPLLGKGGSYRVMQQDLPIPPAWYSSFARWHMLALMRAPRTLREIAEVARGAEHPEALRHLIRLIEDDAGYALYRAVSSVKAMLSRAEEATLDFRHAEFALSTRITRSDFNHWITPELHAIGRAVDAALADAHLPESAVDRVFLTGGTSLVPAIRALFAARFGTARVTAGGEFVSVAEGLALMGASLLPK